MTVEQRGYSDRFLPAFHAAADSALWALAVPLSAWLRYDFDLSRMDAARIARWAMLAIIVQIAAGYVGGLYRRRWKYGSFEEVRAVALTSIAVGLALFVAVLVAGDAPRSVPILATALAMLAQVAFRSAWRLYNEQQNRRRVKGRAAPIVVAGAGNGGEQIIRLLQNTSSAPYDAVAIVDDDPSKRNLQLHGVDVAGNTDQIVQVAQAHGAETVLVAIPSAPSSVLQRITRTAEAAGLKVLVLPGIDEMFGAVNVADIRPISPLDLLGREQADIDPKAIAQYVTGRRVLVTGAGGSIGSELCRQISPFEPAELLMLDRDESGLHTTQLSLHGEAMLTNPNIVLADIRDRARMFEVFDHYKPEVVFHAAALKHLPLLELHPDEGWKTNVLGTRNLLDAADAAGVARFVNVSTDKAANPTSVLGYTKRLTERLTAAKTAESETACVSVRFGNVLGSNGSVLKAFEAQSRRGGPLTVTHPDITRYFMTVEEASRLVIYAGAIGEPGNVMILDMGEPVKILDVAQRIANQHQPPLEIVFTGLRPNEKMHEDLTSDLEDTAPTSHPSINCVPVDPLASDSLPTEAPSPDGMRAVALSAQSAERSLQNGVR